MVGSYMSNQLRGVNDGSIDPDLNPVTEWQGTWYEPFTDRALHVQNRASLKALEAQIDMEQRDVRTLRDAGLMGTFAEIAVGAVDLPSIIPAGRLMQVGRFGYRVGASALSMGGAGAGAALVQEIGLHSTQETRSVPQSAIAVGGGLILGAMLGAGGAKFLSNAEWTRAAQGLERDVYAPGPVLSDAAEAEMKGLVDESKRAGAASPSPYLADGAAKVDTNALSLDDLTIYGRVPEAAANSTAQLSPTLRGLTSPSVAARNILFNLVENPVYLKGYYEGHASARAVETVLKGHKGTYADAMEATRVDWIAARKAGEKLTWDEYRIRVGRAIYNGYQDAGGSASVAKTAQTWRSKVIEPPIQKAIDAHLLAEDVELDKAGSFFSHAYNAPEIEARSGEFKQVVREWAVGELQRQPNALSALSTHELNAYIEGVVDNIYNKITGRTIDTQGEGPFRIVASSQGPLKGRTFVLDDAKAAPFLVDDIEQIGRRYTNVLGANIELSNVSLRLGGDGNPNLGSLTGLIRADYEKLRKGVADEAKLAALNARERSDIRDLEAVRDMLRGKYLPGQNVSGWAKVVKAAMLFNYMRTMGGAMLTSLKGVVLPVMMHGIARWMGDGVLPLMTNLKGFRLAAREARLAGVAVSRVKHSTLAAYAELTNPNASYSPLRLFVENSARAFSRATLMPIWSDFEKSFASVITQNRILENAADWAGLSKRERAYMHYLGIDQSTAQRIDGQFKAHGELIREIRAANTEDWGDDLAREAYHAAIAKDVDSLFSTEGVGDLPLFARTPLGKALLQFRAGALSAHQRVFLRAMQEDQAAVVSGMICTTAIGALSSYLEALESGQEEEFFAHPERLLVQGVERGNLIPLLFQVNAVAEKVGVPGIYAGLQALSSNGRQGRSAPAGTVRSVADGLFGPSGGLVVDLAELAGAAARSDLTPGDIDAMRRLAPYASLPWIRWIIDRHVVPAAKEAVK
ncbi:hypothetical protein [Pleomorphomonas sp. JP5]|uniref:hypothetical protein n=1 Tax=Pleomorphomonas sp. JP5 TaxID=2942998 RepID=UPI00204449D9|nr:hypothetical protein [Pleomorphomonas sp. JP5]MCM5557352.1 hypothetical protein [Pleomorphomonas sp. JP5]